MYKPIILNDSKNEQIVHVNLANLLATVAINPSCIKEL